MNERSSRGWFGIAGWLFADLLLGVAVLFLLASSVAIYGPPPVPTPTVEGALPVCTPTPPATPTATVVPSLDKSPVTLAVTVDGYALIQGDPGTQASVEQQIRAQTTTIANRQAAIVETFGGGSYGNPDDAEAEAVNNVLVRMGKQEHYLFEGAVLEHYVDQDSNFGHITIRMFLFAQPPVLPNPTAVQPTNCVLAGS